MMVPGSESSSSVPNLDLVERVARRYAVENALKFGKARPGPVINKVLGELKELKPYAREIAKIVTRIVEEINSMSPDDIKRLAEELGVTEKKPSVSEEKHLPPLPNVEVWGYVKTRFAPNPDFVIHLGNARAAILSHEYARMYNGKFVLRFEDTDPRIKVPMPEAYEMIREDLRWLGLSWDEEYVQSLRMEIYYEIAKKLIEVGGAYVDLCPPQEFRKYRDAGKPCPHRDEPVEVQLERFEKMLRGDYGEGEAVLRIKTDLSYPDPSVRDWVAFRIIDTEKHPHPIVGDKYRVWPTYNFAAAVDDHLMGVTHILRGREHAVNTVKQMFLYKHLGWRYPEVINFGRVFLVGFILSKSKIKELLRKGGTKFMGVDDIRFGTIAALRRRGILPETIRQLILELGTKPTDASVAWENIAALNRKIADRKCRRVFVVLNPVKVVIEGLETPVTVSIRYHPSTDLGKRSYTLTKPEVYISRKDYEEFREKGVRLMEFANIEFVEERGDHVVAKFLSTNVDDARKRGLQIVQWVPVEHAVRVSIYRAEGLKLIKVPRDGVALGEKALLTEIGVGEVVQMVRIGFGRIDSKTKSRVTVMYAHD